MGQLTFIQGLAGETSGAFWFHGYQASGMAVLRGNRGALMRSRKTHFCNKLHATGPSNGCNFTQSSCPPNPMYSSALLYPHSYPKPAPGASV
ncbi:hypothetical protein E1301_Tti002887 [Triplophysa tibetana]|uniref:Uncharacterized protein n=1 Tax=Triplophysa tibetana TaxID=1572043 RepID=A0A5A9NPK4_9TELE|nr:hypothetical protein E1301_Tti002887 [Triplophysa tibetana]